MRRFKIEYIDKVQQQGVLGIDLAFGTGLHSALQASLEGEDAALTFNTYWNSHRYNPSDSWRYKELAGMGPEFVRKFEKGHKKHLQAQYLEQRMLAEIQGVQWEGTADFIGLYKGVPCILDYKTSAYNYSPEKILSNPQMPLYAELAKQQLGFEAQRIVYMVFVKGTGSIQVQEAELTPDLLKRALETCVSMAGELQSRQVRSTSAYSEFPRNPTACQMGRHICPWFSRCYGGQK